VAAEDSDDRAPFAIIIMPNAHRQILEVSDWWRRNRQPPPRLFEEELDRALLRLARYPSLEHRRHGRAQDAGPPAGRHRRRARSRSTAQRAATGADGDGPAPTPHRSDPRFRDSRSAGHARRRRASPLPAPRRGRECVLAMKVFREHADPEGHPGARSIRNRCSPSSTIDSCPMVRSPLTLRYVPFELPRSARNTRPSRSETRAWRPET